MLVSHSVVGGLYVVTEHVAVVIQRDANSTNAASPTDKAARPGTADVDKRTAPAGRFAKDQFDIDLERDTVTCPNGQSTTIRRGKDGDGTAYFGPACDDCPLRAQCTTSGDGRTIAVGRYEQRLADAHRRRQDPAWVTDYRATRPKIERKLGHLMRLKHGGRRARKRGTTKIEADLTLLAAAPTSLASPCSGSAPHRQDGPWPPPEQSRRTALRLSPPWIATTTRPAASSRPPARTRPAALNAHEAP